MTKINTQLKLRFSVILKIIIITMLCLPSLAEAKPCEKVDYIIGDSIAWMLQRNIDCQTKTFYLDTKGARTPSMILNAIVAAKKKSPHIFDGANIILSSGASNDPGRLDNVPAPTQLDKIERQLQELSGAHKIVLLGTGRGDGGVLNSMHWNEILRNLSKKYSNVVFYGPLVTYKDPVHPRPSPHKDFQIIYDKAVNEEKIQR